MPFEDILDFHEMKVRLCTADVLEFVFHEYNIRPLKAMDVFFLLHRHGRHGMAIDYVHQRIKKMLKKRDRLRERSCE